MSQDRDKNTVLFTSPAAFTTGVYPSQYAGAPRCKAGRLWAYEYPRRDCWVQGDPVVDNAPVKNLWAQFGCPDNGILLVAGATPMTFVDDVASGNAAGFQLNGGVGNMIQIDAGTDFLQDDMGDDYLFETVDIYPNTSAIDSAQFLLSKCTGAATNQGAGMFLCRFGGRSGIAPVTVHYKCSDNNALFFDYENTNVAPAGEGPGLHQLAMAKIGGTLRAYYDGVLIDVVDLATSTFSANSNALTHGNRIGAGTTNVITGLKMIADMGVDLTKAAAALGGITTAQLADKLVAQSWRWHFARYGALT